MQAVPDLQLGNMTHSALSQSRQHEQRRSKDHMCMISPIPYSRDYHDCEHDWCREAYLAVVGNGQRCQSWKQIGRVFPVSSRISVTLELIPEAIQRDKQLTLSWTDSTFGRRLMLVYLRACCIDAQLWHLYSHLSDLTYSSSKQSFSVSAGSFCPVFLARLCAKVSTPRLRSRNDWTACVWPPQFWHAVVVCILP